MMRIGISSREKKVLAGGVTMIALLLFLSRGLPAWKSWHDEAMQSAREMTEEAARADGAVRALPAILDSLERRKDRFVKLAPVFVGIEPPASAAGTLASLLSGIAHSANVTLGTLRIGSDSASGKVVSRLAVRAEAIGDIRGITTLLLELERRTPILAIRELTISQPEPAAPSTQPEALRVELLVEGLAFDPRGKEEER